MELKDRLVEFRNSRDKTTFTNYFSAYPGKVKELIQIVKDLSPYPYKEYGSWMLCHLVKENPEAFQRWYADFVDLIFQTEDQTVLRNVMVCLTQLNFESYRDGEFIDRLMGFIQDASNKVALQVYSIYVLINVANKYPELIDEFRQTIDFHSRNKTAAYQVAQRNFHRAFPEK